MRCLYERERDFASGWNYFGLRGNSFWVRRALAADCFWRGAWIYLFAVTDFENLSALDCLEAAHTMMFKWQKEKGISEKLENMEWFEIMGFLAQARRILMKDFVPAQSV